MKKCPFCAEDVQDAAVYCKHCHRPLTSAPLVSNRSSNLPMMLGVAGVVLLFVGVFLPIVRLPILGSMNYFQNGRGDGVIVLLMAAVAVLLLVRRRFVWLMVPGASTLAGLVLAIFRLQSRISEMRASQARDLADNPFRGFAEALTQSVQLEYGWAVLALGAVALISAALLAAREGLGSIRNPIIVTVISTGAVAFIAWAMPWIILYFE